MFTPFTFLSLTQPLYTCKSISHQKPGIPFIHHADSSFLSRRHPVATATAVRAIWVLVLWVKTAQVPCEPMIASNFIETDPEAERWTIDIAVWEKAQKVAREKVFKAATCLGWAVQTFQQVGIMLPDHGPGTGTTWWGRTPLPIKSGNVYRHSRLLLNYCLPSYNLLKAWPLLKRSVGPTQFSISARSSQGKIYI